MLIGIAKAVHFLHTGVIPGFFNNRLKTNNILLNERGMAKLSDYGLSVISEATGNCEVRLLIYGSNAQPCNMFLVPSDL